MLRNIPPILSPELLKVLAEMGHGDTIVIGDANFAAASMAKKGTLVRCDGLKATDLMDAILSLMPLDEFVEKPVFIMDKEPRHAELECPVWDEFKDIVAKYDERGAEACGMISRKEFYKKARKAYAVVATTETAFMPVLFFKRDACRKQIKTDIKQHKKCVKAVISDGIPLFSYEKRIYHVCIRDI